MEYQKFDQGYILRLDPGEEIVDSLTRMAEKESIQLGSVSGIGATNDATIGVFDTSKLSYHTRHYEGEYEIASLLGNISQKDGQPYIHLHITISNPMTEEIHAGHLTSAVISATLELFIHVWSGQAGRKFSNTVGLNLLEFSEDSTKI